MNKSQIILFFTLSSLLLLVSFLSRQPKAPTAESYGTEFHSPRVSPPIPTKVRPVERLAHSASQTKESLAYLDDMNRLGSLAQRTTDEEERWAHIILAENNLKTSLALLSSERNSGLSERNEETRRDAIKHLDDALFLADERLKAELGAQIAALIQSENLTNSHGADDTQVKNFAGDKIELYLILRRHCPECAKEILEAKHLPFHDLISYAEKVAAGKK